MTVAELIAVLKCYPPDLVLRTLWEGTDHAVDHESIYLGAVDHESIYLGCEVLFIDADGGQPRGARRLHPVPERAPWLLPPETRAL